MMSMLIKCLSSQMLPAVCGEIQPVLQLEEQAKRRGGGEGGGGGSWQEAGEASRGFLGLLAMFCSAFSSRERGAQASSGHPSFALLDAQPTQPCLQYSQ